MSSEIIRTEVIADLYYKRFGKLAPGKSEPPETRRSSMDPENVEQYKKWLDSGQAWLDALDEIHYLRLSLDTHWEWR